jgi:hypothetical protein
MSESDNTKIQGFYEQGEISSCSHGVHAYNSR